MAKILSERHYQTEWPSDDPATWAETLNWLFRAKKKIPTPFQALNWLYGGGNREGWATAICGVDSTGKSLIAGACALEAVAGGYRVGVINLDMDRRAWMLRALASVGNLDASALWELEEQSDFLQEETLREIAHKIRDLPGVFVIEDSRPRTSEQAAAIIEGWGHQGVDLVIVDYVQLLRPGLPNVRGAEAFDCVVGDLVTAARRHQMAALLICQLNREGKMGERASLYHVLGGSAIERHCDVGIVLDHTTTKVFDQNVVLKARCEKNRLLGRMPAWDVVINKRNLQVAQGNSWTTDWRRESRGSND